MLKGISPTSTAKGSAYISDPGGIGLPLSVPLRLKSPRQCWSLSRMMDSFGLKATT